MAKQTVTRLVDDLDKSEADRSVRFSWQGTTYEIDLSDKNAKAFEKAISPYLDAARRVSGGSRRSATRRPAPKAAVDLTAVRTWAAANGHKIADRGRIASSVLDAFHAAQRVVADHVEAPVKAAATKRTPRAAAAKRPAKKAPARKAAATRGRPRKAAAKRA
jgi:hypothetical protein